MKKTNHKERGNVFFALFGAVAVVGVIGAASMSIMRGPLTTMVEVNKRTQAESQMQLAGRMAIVQSAEQSASGDCDSDGFIEPILPAAFGTTPGGTLTNGGALPNTIGATKTDPWGTEYGYCVWNAGPVDSGGGCSGSLIDGSGDSSEDYAIISIISAGPDRTFSTNCQDYATAGAGNKLAIKPSGTDDIIMDFTYGEAQAFAGGLWRIKSGDPATAEISKELEVTGGARFSGASTLDLSGLTGSLLLPDDIASGACNAANDGVVRRNTSTSPPTVEICDFSGGSGWVSVAAGATTLTQLSDGDTRMQVNDTVPEVTIDVDGTEVVSIDTTTLDASTLDITTTGDLAAGNTTLTGTLNVTNDVDFDSNLNVDGTVTITNGGGADPALDVSGDVTAANVDLTGDLTLGDNESIFWGAGTVNITGSSAGDALTLNAGETSLSGNLTAVDITGTGDANLNALTVDTVATISNGAGAPIALTVEGDIDVNGDASIAGDIFDVNNATLTGKLEAADGEFSGDVQADTFTIGTAPNLGVDLANLPDCDDANDKLTWTSGSGWGCGADTAGGSSGDPNDELQNLQQVLTEGNSAGGLNILNVGTMAVGSSTVDGTLELDVTGDIGAGSYCNSAGAQCFTTDEMNQDLGEVLAVGSDAGGLTDLVNLQGLAIGSSTISNATNLNLLLDVTGDIGAIEYCDEDGLNCFDPAAVATLVSGAVTEINDLTDAATSYGAGNNIFMGNSTGGSFGATDINNTAIGVLSQNSLNNSASTENVSVGNLTLTNNTGDNNVAIGVRALNANTSGTGNVAVGRNALINNQDGGGNVAVGLGALSRNVSESSNVAVGNAAGFYNVGNSNTFLGTRAGTGADGVSTAFRNVLLGYEAGNAIEAGNNNTIVGHQAGLALTDGSDNIFFGRNAGDLTTTGAGNIIIGVYQDASAATVSNELNIGGTIFGNLGAGRVGLGVADATAIDSSALLELDSTTLGFLMPRMTGGERDLIASPATGLQVYNTSTNTVDYYDGTTWVSFASTAGNANRLIDADSDTSIEVDTATDGSANTTVFTNNGAESMRIDATGNLGIGTATPSDKITVLGGNVSVREDDDGNPAVELGAGLQTGYAAFFNDGTANTLIRSAVGSETYFNAGNVVFGNTTADGSARVQIDATTQGFLLPRVADPLNDIATPATGLIAYDSTDNELQVYNGTTWESFSGSSAMYVDRIQDGDNDTYIDVDTADDDDIRITMNGNEIFVLSGSGGAGDVNDMDMLLRNGSSGSTNYLRFGATGGATYGFTGYDGAAAVMAMQSNTVSSGGISFRTGGNNERLRILDGGNVGIGATAANTTSLLTVANGDFVLKTDGATGTNAIQMSADGSTGTLAIRNGPTTYVRLSSSAGVQSFFNQGNFVFGSNTANDSAQLQVDATDAGFLPPRVADPLNDIATPATGLIAYDSTDNELQVYDGTSWVAFSGGGASIIDRIQDADNNTYIDVDISDDGADDDIFVYAGGEKVAGFYGATSFPAATVGTGLYVLQQSGNRTEVHIKAGSSSNGSNNLIFGHSFSGNSYGSIGTDGVDTEHAHSLYLSSYADRDIKFLTNSAERMRILGENGNVGIGTAAPSNSLEVVNTDLEYQILVMQDDSTFSQNNGGGIGFKGRSSGGGSSSVFGSIKGYKAYVSAGNTFGGLIFKTKGPLSTLSEKMRITDLGNVTIGTTISDASAKLQVDANDAGFLPPRIADPDGDITTPATGLIAYDSTDNELQVYDGTSWVTFSGAGAATDADWQIDSGNGFVYNTADSIGIGTATPNGLLQIAGAGMLDNDRLLSVTEDGDDLFYVTARDGGRIAHGPSRFFGVCGIGSYCLEINNQGLRSTDHADIQIVSREDELSGNYGIALLNDGLMPTGVPLLKVGIGTNAATAEYLRVDSTGGIGIGTGAENDASAVMEISSTSRGFLPPRIADPANDVTTPATGLIAYDSTDNELQVYNGTSWEAFSGGSASIASRIQDDDNNTHIEVDTIGDGSGNSIVFTNNTVQSMIIDANGQIGIGTAATIEGVVDINASGFAVPDLVFGNGASGKFGFSATGNGLTIQRKFSGGFQPSSLSINRGTGNVAINVADPASVDTSAILQVDATDRGFLPPRVADPVNDITTPTTGLIAYDSTDNELQVYDGTSWVTFSGGGAVVIALDDLTDAETDYATDFNLFIGQNAGASIIAGGQYNVAIGQNAGDAITDGDNNITIGYDAGTELSTASDATIVGTGAGAALTTGQDNTFIGRSAGASTETGRQNTYVGSGAGANGSAGAQFNTALGYNAGRDFGGINNTAIGNSAGVNITGNENAAFGSATLSRNTNGSNNTAFGSRAIEGTANGAIENNTALGFGAGRLLENGGDNNLFLGYLAGDVVTTGTNNIIIGYDVDASSATASNELNIGNALYGNLSNGNIGVGTSAIGDKLTVGSYETPSFTVNQDQTIGVYGAGSAYFRGRKTSTDVEYLFGVSTTDEVFISSYNSDPFDIRFGSGDLKFIIAPSGNVGIGPTVHTDIDASSILELDATDKGFLPPRIADPASDITTPATGLIAYDSTDNELQVYDGTSWVTFSGGAAGAIALDDLTDVEKDANNLFAGEVYGAALTNAGSNTSLGIRALNSLTDAASPVNAGDSNTAIGFEAMEDMETGIGNTAVGAGSLGWRTEGNSNTAVGVNALRFQSGGDNNTAVGNLAGANPIGATNQRNTYLGTLAGRGTPNSTGVLDNVVIGFEAGLALDTDSVDNVIVGSQAGDALTTASRNVLLGRNAGGANQTMNDLVAIGYDAGAAVNTSAFGGPIFIGNYAGATLTDGFGTMAIGYNALTGATGNNATNTVAIGQAAMFDAGASGSASGNLAVGDFAGGYFGTGNDNVFLGRSSGAGVAAWDGASNVFVGQGIGAAMTGGNSDNNIFIGQDVAATLTSGDNNILIGQGADVTSATSSSELNIGNLLFGDLSADGSDLRNIAIGVTDVTAIQNSAILQADATTQGFLPPRVADPAGDITTPATGLIAYDSTDNELQVYDGTSWVTFSGGGAVAIAINDLTDAYADADSIILGNGTPAGATQDTVIGISAHVNAGADSFSNVVIGWEAGGGNNAAQADGQMTTNTIIGARAGGQIGRNADGNVLLGYTAGSQMAQDADNNIVIGRGSGSFIDDDDNNILIGNGVTVHTNWATSDHLNIGNTIFADMTNAATGDTGGARVGINSATPASALEINYAGTPSDDASPDPALITLRNSTNQGGAGIQLFEFNSEQGFEIINYSSSDSNSNYLSMRAYPNDPTPIEFMRVHRQNQEVQFRNLTVGGPASYVSQLRLMENVDASEDGVIFEYDGVNNIFHMKSGTGGTYPEILTIGRADRTIGIGTAGIAAAASAQLEIASATRGFLPPRIADPAGDVTAPATGLIAYDSTDNELQVYNGTAWEAFSGGSAGAIAINDLTDATHDSSSQYNLFLGNGAGGSNIGSFNLGIGQDVLSNMFASGGESNIGIGIGSLVAADDAFENVVVGRNAGGAITSGDNNILMGYQAGVALTTSNENIMIGTNAGSSLSTTGNNVLIGHLAGNNTTTSYRSVAIGDFSGQGMGYQNTFVGERAGRDATSTGVDNTFIGRAAGQNFESGSGNIILGTQLEGAAFTSGSSNILIGYHLDTSAATASNELNIGNTLYGDLANGYLGIGTGVPAHKLEVLDGSIVLKEDDDGNIAVEIASDNSKGWVELKNAGANTVFITGSTTDDNYFNGGSVVFGNTTADASAQVEIVSTSKGFLPPRNADPATSIATPATGLIAYDSTDNELQVYNGTAWEAFSGGSAGAIAINDLTDGKTDASSVFLGSGAGASDNGNNRNTAVGVSTMAAIDGGEYNTAIGHLAMTLTTDGGSNVAIGYNSLAANVDRSKNVAIGRGTMELATNSNTNIAIGFEAMSTTTSGGTNNVAIGEYALDNVDGDNNIGIGSSAGDATTSGSGNILIGNSVDASAATASNELNIGDTIFGDLANGEVGIGTNNPDYLLHVEDGDVAIGDTADATRKLFLQRNGTMIGKLSTDDSDLTLAAMNGENIRIVPDGGITDGGIMVLDSGDVGVGTVDPSDDLHVYDSAGNGKVVIEGAATAQSTVDLITTGDGGTHLDEGTAYGWQMFTYNDSHVNVNDRNDLGFAYFNGGWQNYFYMDSATSSIGIFNTSPDAALDVTGDIEYTGTITDVSDRRLKTDIHKLDTDDVVAKLAQIDTYSFKMKGDEAGRVEYGVMAQDLEKLFPELVKTANDEMGTKSVNYMGLIAPMIEATKALKSKNDDLKAELAEMKSQQAEVLAAVKSLNTEVKGLKVHTGYGIKQANSVAMLILMLMVGGLSMLLFVQRKRYPNNQTE